MRIDEIKNLVSMLYDMELNNYMMSCCIPVSYTHLDVYKRQRPMKTRTIRPALIRVTTALSVW